MLTDAERRAVLDGDFPRLAGIDRFEVGDTFELTSRVSVRIEKRDLHRGRVEWRYTVIDHRDRFLRSRPPTTGKVVPAEKLSADEIRKAAEQSAYDGNVQDPLDAGVAVPQEVQNQYTKDAHARFQVVKGEELAKREARSRAERLRQAEMALRQQGKSAEQYARVVDQAVDAMQREAKAA